MRVEIRNSTGAVIPLKELKEGYSYRTQKKLEKGTYYIVTGEDFNGHSNASKHWGLQSFRWQ
jgi:hypothetical protein